MPEKVFVDIKLLLPKQLEKDLMEHQRVCTTCKGLGIVIRDNKYKLRSEDKPWIIGFPYKNQSLFPCPDCYNGIQSVCKYCGAPGSRMYIHAETNCQCEGASAERSRKRAEKEKEQWDKAEKIRLEEAIQRFELIFIDGPEEYISPGDLIDRLDELKGDDPGLPSPYIWGTHTMELTLPTADDLITDACEELYEDALSNISKSEIDDLQKALDLWVEGISGTTTYFPDYKIGILVEYTATAKKEE